MRSDDLVSEKCSKALSHYPGIKYEQACADTGVDLPSWPWQISVVPMVPSTKTALLVISCEERGGGEKCRYI